MYIDYEYAQSSYSDILINKYNTLDEFYKDTHFIIF